MERYRVVSCGEQFAVQYQRRFLWMRWWVFKFNVPNHDGVFILASGRSTFLRCLPHRRRRLRLHQRFCWFKDEKMETKQRAKTEKVVCID